MYEHFYLENVSVYFISVLLLLMKMFSFTSNENDAGTILLIESFKKNVNYFAYVWRTRACNDSKKNNTSPNTRNSSSRFSFEFWICDTLNYIHVLFEQVYLFIWKVAVELRNSWINWRLNAVGLRYLNNWETFNKLDLDWEYN